MLRINLDDPDIMNTKDAALKWGKKDDSSIRHRINEFPKGTIRKIARDWIVTREGMEAVFGDMKIKEDSKMDKFKVTVTENVDGEGKAYVSVLRAENAEVAEAEVRSQYERAGKVVMAIKSELV